MGPQSAQKRRDGCYHSPHTAGHALASSISLNRSGSVTSSSIIDAGELPRGGNRVSLPEQSLRFLEVLLEHPGVLVSRDQLRERLWAADHLRGFRARAERRSEAAARCVGGLGRPAAFIETVPKRGYRFIATLIPTPAASVADEPQRWPGLWRVAAFLIALVALGLVADRWMRPRQPAPVLAAPVAPE